jgi:hypothetical protein
MARRSCARPCAVTRRAPPHRLNSRGSACRART